MARKTIPFRLLVDYVNKHGNLDGFLNWATNYVHPKDKVPKNSVKNKKRVRDGGRVG